MHTSYFKKNHYEGLYSNETKSTIISEIVDFGWEHILPNSDSYSESEPQDQVSGWWDKEIEKRMILKRKMKMKLTNMKRQIEEDL